MTIRKPGQRSSVTLVALCFTAALGIAVTSYLVLCTRSYDLATRQMHNDQTRELAQTGFEEALWALNQNTWNASGPAGADSWGTSGSDHTITISYGTVGPGATGSVAITVSNYASTGASWPSITSTATVTMDSGQVFTKTLQATTAPAPLFGNAIASSSSYVSFVSGGTVDSWNSDPDGDPAHGGIAYSFSAGTAANYAAVVAGNDNGSYGVILNRALVDGYVTTFGQPVSYSTSGSPGGRVKGPTTSGAVNIDPTRLGQSAFIPNAAVFPVVLPSTSGSNFGGLLGDILALVAALLGTPAYVDTYEITGNLTCDNIPILFPNMTISKPMKIIVDGSLTIGGASGRITILPGASLDLFVAGDVTIGGTGFNNQTGDARKLAIYCTNTSTSNTLTYTTSSSFTGVIYCVHKPIDIQQNATFYGALLSDGFVRFSSSATSPTFHYDSALRNVRFAGVTTPYVLKQVTEP
ncbi:MAG TPA: hypothetical protein VHD32_13910 [Candidatus Didemnitutus sp.]|nr:hypothetical protein [Candidatus Didemnitutus sp.]